MDGMVFSLSSAPQWAVNLAARQSCQHADSSLMGDNKYRRQKVLLTGDAWYECT